MASKILATFRADYYVILKVHNLQNVPRQNHTYMYMYIHTCSPSPLPPHSLPPSPLSSPLLPPSFRPLSLLNESL